MKISINIKMIKDIILEDASNAITVVFLWVVIGNRSQIFDYLVKGSSISFAKLPRSPVISFHFNANFGHTVLKIIVAFLESVFKIGDSTSSIAFVVLIAAGCEILDVRTQHFSKFYTPTWWTTTIDSWRKRVGHHSLIVITRRFNWDLVSRLESA